MTGSSARLHTQTQGRRNGDCAPLSTCSTLFELSVGGSQAEPLGDTPTLGVAALLALLGLQELLPDVVLSRATLRAQLLLRKQVWERKGLSMRLWREKLSSDGRLCGHRRGERKEPLWGLWAGRGHRALQEPWPDPSAQGSAPTLRPQQCPCLEKKHPGWPGSRLCLAQRPSAWPFSLGVVSAGSLVKCGQERSEGNGPLATGVPETFST